MIDSEPSPPMLLALAVSPSFMQDKLVLAGLRKGLLRSQDAGKSWEPRAVINDEPLSVTALAFSPGFAKDRTVFAALPGGVAYSHDAGETWFWTRLPTPAPYVSALLPSPTYAENRLVFAATLEDGVLRSGDGGLSWQGWNFGLLDKQVLCLAHSGETLYAGTGSGLFCSHNEGRSWREVAMPARDGVLSLAAAGEHLFIGTEAHGVYRSMDNGASWERISAIGVDAPINQIQVTGGKVPLVRVLTGDGWLVESSNRGETWRRRRLPSRDAPVALAGNLVGYAAGEITEISRFGEGTLD